MGAEVFLQLNDTSDGYWIHFSLNQLCWTETWEVMRHKAGHSE